MASLSFTPNRVLLEENWRLKPRGFPVKEGWLVDEEKQGAIELSDIEKSAVGEICDLMTAALAKDFAGRLSSDVGATPSNVELQELEEVARSVPTPVIFM